MSLDVAGLTPADKMHYYRESVLSHKDGLFLVSDWSSSKFQGHLLINGVFTPSAQTPKSLSIVHPREGYVRIDKKVFKVEHRIARTRRKGYNQETYKLHSMVPETKARSCVEKEALLEIFKAEEKRTFPQAMEEFEFSKGITGTILSKCMCIVVSNKAKYLWLRGTKLGLVKKGVLQLKPEHKVFMDELKEYQVPVEVIKSEK